MEEDQPESTGSDLKPEEDNQEKIIICRGNEIISVHYLELKQGDIINPCGLDYDAICGERSGLTIKNDFGPIVHLTDVIYNLIEKMDDYISIGDVFICIPISFHDKNVTIPPKEVPIRAIKLSGDVNNFHFNTDIPYHKKNNFVIFLVPIKFALKIYLDIESGTINTYYGAW